MMAGDEDEVCGGTDALDDIEARNDAVQGYTVSSYDWTHAAYGRGRVTEAHHAAEEMRLPKTSAVQDAGIVPAALICSSRLP